MVTEEDGGQEVAELDVPDVLDVGAAGACSFFFFFLLVIIAIMSLCAGRKPLREVTLLLRRMFLSTPAPVTTWAGESTFGDRR